MMTMDWSYNVRDVYIVAFLVVSILSVFLEKEAIHTAKVVGINSVMANVYILLLTHFQMSWLFGCCALMVLVVHYWALAFFAKIYKTNIFKMLSAFWLLWGVLVLAIKIN